MAGLGSVGYILFKPTDYAIFPGGDAFVVECEVIDKVYQEWQRHTMAQNTRNQLGVVPVLFVE